ncbi:MAG: tRNA epoxyqueuosine(34) reductase QueG [Anaerolineales bacterium]|nr:tRNA epoxyqueuosine(34) reductase QueG [Anaerolineales bacterium]
MVTSETQTLTEKIKAHARRLGFPLVGVTTPDPPPHYAAYERWLEHGYHGEMGYLATERNLERRADPRLILLECQSILVLGMPYDNPASVLPLEDVGIGRVAAYAWGADYHDVIPEKLRALVAYIEDQVGCAVPNRWYTDTGPLLERDLAQRAGLGWAGKNSMLINPQVGSYFFLAEILLGIELQADAPFESDHCGTCTRCIDACPTSCITPERTVDARRCISYLTIELKTAVPGELRGQLGEWVFGCDVCQEVCPWNQRFAPPQGNAAFAPRLEVPYVDLQAELELTPQAFNRKFKGSPLKRTKRRGYLRNVALALGNRGGAEAVVSLVRALREDIEPLVRAHAAYALGQLGGETAKAALQKAHQTEQDAEVLGEIRAALERFL